jgi:uncharacterized protein (DUF934 family)
MATLIKNRGIVSDNWQTLSVAEADALSNLAADAAVLVPLAWWQNQRETLLARPGKLGVWLDSHDDPAAIAADLPHFKVIAVNFPKFTDGRGFSTARLLRERYGYQGELRAIGEVLRDQLQEMERCGFDAFLLRADQNAQAALSAFADLSDQYQTSVSQPLPLFRRRLA